ncbi:hypothetical protein LguiB_026503 [Lonicera macranthoides]
MVDPLSIRTCGKIFPRVRTVIWRARLCFLPNGDKSLSENDRLLWTVSDPIMFGSCSGVESGDMTASSKSLMKAVLWGLEATKRPQIVMCACVFFNYSSTRSSPTSLGGGDFSASIGGGWYTFPERVICCIQRDVGSDPSEVSDDSGSADQLKVPGEVSVIQIVSL